MILQNSHQEVQDGGPIYKETNLENFIVEPFNAMSASLFIFVSIYWFFVFKRDNRKEPFLYTLNIIFIIGGLSGVLYHSLRTNFIFLLFDALSIAVLFILLHFYLLIKIYKSYILPLIFTLILVSMRYIMYEFMGNKIGINLAYSAFGIYLLMPIILMLIKTKFANFDFVIISLICFITAILFRWWDLDIPIPMGSHFLWHVYGTISSFFLFKYIYNLPKKI